MTPESYFLGTDPVIDPTQCFFQQVRLISAGLGHIRPTSSVTPQRLGEPFNNLAGMKPGQKVLGDHRNQQDFFPLDSA